MECNQCKERARKDLIRLGLSEKETEIIADSKITDIQINFKNGNITLEFQRNDATA